jgi:hypothetical protein
MRTEASKTLKMDSAWYCIPHGLVMMIILTMMMMMVFQKIIMRIHHKNYSVYAFIRTYRAVYSI